MFSATVPVNSSASCATIATRPVHHSRSTCRRSTPPARTTPSDGSRSPSSNCTRVDFPDPDGPITPTTSFRSIRSETSTSASRSGVYANRTRFSSIGVADAGRSPPPDAAASSYSAIVSCIRVT